jgi:hypothetical protein
MTRQQAVSFLSVVVVVCALPTRSSLAYVREVTTTGIPVAWKNPCVSMQLLLGDPPPPLTADQVLQASLVAGSVWSQPLLACSDFRLSVVPDSRPTADVAIDGNNLIVFRRDVWCDKSSSTTDPASATCYPASALAMTTISKNKKTGEIVDADIAFNAVKYSWGDRTTLSDPDNGTVVDFQNALTHELGHVIGLDHPCYTDEPRLLDNNGLPELDCYNNPTLPESIADSTMYPSISVKDMLRRDLSLDDQQGVCDIYPYVHATCPSSTTDGGCASVPTRNSGTNTNGRLLTCATVGLVSVLMALVCRRRTKRI